MTGPRRAVGVSRILVGCSRQPSRAQVQTRVSGGGASILRSSCSISTMPRRRAGRVQFAVEARHPPPVRLAGFGANQEGDLPRMPTISPSASWRSHLGVATSCCWPASPTLRTPRADASQRRAMRASGRLRSERFELPLAIFDLTPVRKNCSIGRLAYPADVFPFSTGRSRHLAVYLPGVIGMAFSAARSTCRGFRICMGDV